MLLAMLTLFLNQCEIERKFKVFDNNILSMSVKSFFLLHKYWDINQIINVNHNNDEL